MQKILITLVATTFVGVGLSTFSTPTSHAASFSKYITSHTWTMTAGGSQGGYNGKTKVTGKKIHSVDKIHSMTDKWTFSSLKKKNANTYYGKAKHLEYNENKLVSKSTQSYMLKLKSKKEFWLVPKHYPNVPGNYKGNSAYGAAIFQLK